MPGPRLTRAEREEIAIGTELGETLDQIAERIGRDPSVGSVADAYDNALVESVIGLLKTEIIKRRGPWRPADAVEFEALEWVDWFNHRQLLGPIGLIPPAEAEAAYYRDNAPAEAPAGLNPKALR